MPLDTLMHCNKQWSTRPADERYTSLHDMGDFFANLRRNSAEKIISSRRLMATPTDNTADADIQITGPNGHAYTPSNWAFGQLAALAGAPAGYMRNLPAPLAADCLNYGFKYSRDIEDVGCLLTRSGDDISIRAATGPRYGRVWNSQVVSTLIKRFGSGNPADGGDFTVPGEFGKRVVITKENTTLYAGDRDMFVFLADETNRIEVPGRRNGQTGQMARGFFVWNSEVGAATLGVATFLFDYVCANRIVWGAQQFKQVTIRHSAGAPDRWADEVVPALRDMSRASALPITQAIANAKAARLKGDDVNDWLAQRFGRQMVQPVVKAAKAEEGRPIENVWDAVCAVTAHARSINHQDERVALERKAGALLDKVA